MSNTRTPYTRIARRETHSPRSVLAITLAIILILAAAYAVTEIVLAIANQPPLLIAPGTAAAGVAGVTDLASGFLLAAGIVLALIGLVLVTVSLTAGRRARHVIHTDRAVTVIENGALASALARQASYAGNIDPDSTRVTVTHSRAVVDITPASGRSIDKQAIQTAVDEQLESYDVRPRLRSKITVKTAGRVGA